MAADVITRASDDQIRYPDPLHSVTSGPVLYGDDPMRKSPTDNRPERRPLRIFAFDPMISRAGDHRICVEVPYKTIEREERSFATIGSKSWTTTPPPGSTSAPSI
jgi:hypothetical protein